MKEAYIVCSCCGGVYYCTNIRGTVCMLCLGFAKPGCESCKHKRDGKGKRA